MMSVCEGELELDAPEERRGRMENEAVLAGVERSPEVADPTLSVGFRSGQNVIFPIKLNQDASRRLAMLDIQDVR
jgi:hypothetical protein